MLTYGRAPGSDMFTATKFQQTETQQRSKMSKSGFAVMLAWLLVLLDGLLSFCLLAFISLVGKAVSLSTVASNPT